MASEDYEVLVSDDERSPATRSLVQEILPGAIYLEGPQRGPAANRNNAAKTAAGEWLVFTDDDCVPEPDWLNAYKEAIQEDRRVYEGKTTCKEGLMSPLDTAPVNETGGYLWSCNMAIFPSLFHDLGGFDENFPFPAAEDVDFRDRLRARGVTLKFVPEAVVNHPPRKINGIDELIRYHRSIIYLCVAKRREDPKLKNTLWFILRHRTRLMLRPKVQDYPKAMFLLMIECAILCLRFHTWKSEIVQRGKLG